MDNNENKLEKPSAELINWYVYYDGLYGKTQGSNKFKDGTTIRTSAVVRVKKLSDCFIVETLNTIYTCRFDNVTNKIEDSIDELYTKLKNIVGCFM